MVTFNDIKHNEEIRTYIKMADDSLSPMGFTEHGFAHVTRVMDVTEQILKKMGYDERTIELAKISAYMHDIGNIVNRIDHAQSGAVMAFRLLTNLNMPAEEISRIISAIGNHDESTAFPVNEIAAALILADKSDVRRSRVRTKDHKAFDIHDRVNYAVEKSDLYFSDDNRELILDLTIDLEISSVMEYFEIFLQRMVLCRNAAKTLGVRFGLVINNSKIL